MPANRALAGWNGGVAGKVSPTPPLFSPYPHHLSPNPLFLQAPMQLLGACVTAAWRQHGAGVGAAWRLRGGGVEAEWRLRGGWVHRRCGGVEAALH